MKMWGFLMLRLGNKTNTWFLFFCFMVLGHAYSQENDTGCFFKSNIVCAVAGYQVNRKMGNGFEVPQFLSTKEVKEADCSASGILFYVVFPKKYQGSYFLVHHDGDLASGLAYNLYREGQFYLFPYGGDKAIMDRVITRENLHRMGLDQKKLCSVDPLGERWFFSKSEALCCVEEIDRELSLKRKEVEKFVESNANTYLDRFRFQQTKTRIQNLEQEKKRISLNLFLIENGKCGL